MAKAFECDRCHVLVKEADTKFITEKEGYNWPSSKQPTIGAAIYFKQLFRQVCYQDAESSAELCPACQIATTEELLEEMRRKYNVKK